MKIIFTILMLCSFTVNASESYPLWSEVCAISYVMPASESGWDLYNNAAQTYYILYYHCFNKDGSMSFSYKFMTLKGINQYFNEETRINPYARSRL